MESIEALLDKALQEEQDKGKDRVRSGCFSPSSFGRCYRAQFWNRKNEPQSNPPSAKLLRTFKIGHMFHEMIQGLLKDIEVEVLVEESDVKGFADIVGKDYVADIKTCRAYEFKLICKDGYDVYNSKPGNVLQVVYYALKLHKRHAKLIFVDKEGFEIKEIEVHPGDYVGKLQDELTNLRAYWMYDLLPDAEPRCYKNKDGVSNECAYCSWETKCKEVEQTKKGEK